MDLCRCLALLNIGIMKDGVGDIVNKIFNELASFIMIYGFPPSYPKGHPGRE